MNKCNYCQESNNHISGKPITQAELKPTAGYKSRSCSLQDYLQLFILKGKADKKAGLMIDTLDGARYIDINYCPFCGRKLDNGVMK